MTNYEKYFGTPEKTAFHIKEIIECCDFVLCSKCVLADKERGGCVASGHMIEWLMEEAE